MRTHLANQYLAEDHWTRLAGGWVTFDEEFPDVPIHGLSLDEAKVMPWGYVIATLQDNQWGFRRFAHERGATYINQVGNTNQYVDWQLDPIVLMAAAPAPSPPWWEASARSARSPAPPG